MGNLLLSGIGSLIEAIDTAILKLFSGVFTDLNHAALAQLNAPWMATLRLDLVGVALGLMTVRVGYEVLTRYLLWSEGTADPDGSVITTGILRMVLYFIASSTLAIFVINFGTALGGMVLTAPLGEAFNTTGAEFAGVMGLVMAPVGFGVADTIILGLGFLGVIIGIIAIAVTVAVRAVQFIVYVLAAPFVALGQISPGGGVWEGWWKGLVILALTPAIQLLALKGMVLSLTGAGVKPGDVTQGLVALLLSMGWLVLAFRGAHMLEQWGHTAHSGFGGMMLYAGRTAHGTMTTGVGKKV